MEGQVGIMMRSPVFSRYIKISWKWTMECLKMNNCDPPLRELHTWGTWVEQERSWNFA